MVSNNIYIFLLCFIFANNIFAQKHTINYKCSFLVKDSIRKSMTPPIHSQKPVVKDSKSAAMVAYVYVSNIYGEKIAKKELPYKVSALNDSLWQISGTFPRKKRIQWRGTFYMIIDKNTGKIVSYWHEK